jgi:hypothetical protein
MDEFRIYDGKMQSFIERSYNFFGRKNISERLLYIDCLVYELDCRDGKIDQAKVWMQNLSDKSNALAMAYKLKYISLN